MCTQNVSLEILTNQREAGVEGGSLVRRLRLFGLTLIGFGLLHHADHVFRGNHSGWPFTGTVTPFTFSLLIYPLLIIGLVQLSRGEVRPRYWITVSLLVAGLITFVHFVQLPKYERISTDIFRVYADPGGPPRRYSLAPPPSHREWLMHRYGPHASPIWGWLAVFVVVGLTVAAYGLVWVSFRARAHLRQRG